MATELTVNARDAYIQKIKKLLSDKDKLTSQDGGDGRNKYQIEINKIKKQLKGVEGISFKSLLKDVKKQEREGKFDRGAEGKAKNKLRKKMAGAPEEVLTRGRHAGSKIDKILGKGITGERPRLDSEQEVDLAKGLAGETEAQKKKRKNKMTKAKIASSR